MEWSDWLDLAIDFVGFMHCAFSELFETIPSSTPEPRREWGVSILAINSEATLVTGREAIIAAIVGFTPRYPAQIVNENGRYHSRSVDWGKRWMGL